MPPHYVLQLAHITPSNNKTPPRTQALYKTQRGRPCVPSLKAQQEMGTDVTSRSTYKTDLVLVQNLQEEPAAGSGKQQQQASKSSSGLDGTLMVFGEVKVKSKLMQPAGGGVFEAKDLVQLYNAGDLTVCAIINQCFTYMALGCVCYGLLTCWDATWLLHRPADGRGWTTLQVWTW